MLFFGVHALRGKTDLSATAETPGAQVMEVTKAPVKRNTGVNTDVWNPDRLDIGSRS
jgi:hypothetical protein